MKAYVLTNEELAIIKDKRTELKKEQNRLLKKFYANTADCFDTTSIDRIDGALEAFDFILNTICGKQGR